MRAWIGALAVSIFISAGFVTGATTTQPSVSADQLFILMRSGDSPELTTPSLLTRELIRQSLLMTARDTMGLYTRDEVLRETVPDNIGDISSRTGTMSVMQKWGSSNINVEFTAGNGESETYQLTCPMIRNHVQDMAQLSAIAEQASREEFSDWLHAAGFEDATPEISHDEPPTADIEARLTEMSIFAQYDVVRKTHALIRKYGESPKLVEILVRGYANLGQLTRFQWTGAADVFTARSLLYAQRLAANDPNSGLILQNRAYAFAMAGLPLAAMDDLTHAATASAGAEKPVWVDLIDPLCHYKTQQLLELGKKNPQYEGLANYLAFLTVQNSGSYSLVMQLGQAALSANPLCEQILSTMGDMACNANWYDMGTQGYQDLTRLMVSNFNVIVQSYRGELPKIDDLPAGVRTAWQAAHHNPDLNQDLANVASAFVEAPEAAEPSWSALGRMLQESNFLYVYKAADLQAFYFNDADNDSISDPADNIQQRRPLVKGHPYEPLLDAIILKFRNQPVPNLTNQMHLVDPTMRMTQSRPFTDAAGDQDIYQHRFWNLAQTNLDPTAWDFELGLLSLQPSSNNPESAAWYARALRLLSPYSPVGPASSIRWNWDKVTERLPEFSKKFPDQPAIQREWGEKLYQHGQFEEATAHFESYLKIAPDLLTYHHLADCYLKLHDQSKWLDTLNRAITNSIGYDRYWFQTDLIAGLCDEHEYSRAIPYAKALADEGYDSGYLVRCYTGQSDWQTTDKLLADYEEKYGPSLDWYVWCQASHHGNVAGALKYATVVGGEKADNPLDGAVYAAAEGNTIAQVTILRKGYDQSGDFYQGLFLAIAYDAQGDTADRDIIIQKVIQAGNAYSNYPEYPVIAKMMRDTFTQRGGDLDQAAYHRQFDNLSWDQRLDAGYFAGEILLHHGHEAEGISMLKEAANIPSNKIVGARFAQMELANRGIDPFDHETPGNLPTTNPSQP
jgi:tetratricopeptide (TPR) repeat protein